MFAIRLDDITPDMNWEKFNKAKAMFDQYGIKPLIGVVPDNQDETLTIESKSEEFWDRIRDLQTQGWTIAQHGYQHCYETKKSGILGINPFSEFAGLPFQNQLDKLQKGKEILQINGLHVKIFMAPGHTYDKNTLRALKKCNFEAVTDGYSLLPYEYMGLRFFPSRISRPTNTQGMDTLCLHTNFMCEEDFEELERYIRENRKEVVDFAEYMDLKDVRTRTFFIYLEEQKNLKRKKLRNFVGSDTSIQEFFIRTDHQNKLIKNWKRLLGLPGLLFKLAIRKRK